ncbi:HNH endonuclease [Mycolicibacillus trivialis]|uniref:HNH endonuclease n=1 Tax=Mycolicibacillus trivialis TaxID=1798 RepID=UPI000A15CB34|nr:HNH endonuclease signature motif containing protein [Mycolicibacillus trivialis]
MAKPQFNKKTGRRQYSSADRRYRKIIAARRDPCALCGEEINYQAHHHDPLALEIDHIIPVSRGGQTTLDNLRATHRSCNRARSNRIELDNLAATITNRHHTPPPAHTPRPCPRCGQHHTITCRTWNPAATTTL